MDSKRFLKNIVLLIVLLLCYVPLSANEIDQLKKNYIRVLLNENQKEQELIKLLTQTPKEQIVSDEMVVELTNKYPVSKQDIRKILDGIQSDGSWGDLNYESQDRSGWSPKIHIERILVLAKYYVSIKSNSHLSVEIEEAIHKTLGFWIDRKPLSPNWWHNDVGVPKNLGCALLLFEDKLTSAEKEGVMVTMKRSTFALTGQNRVWLAGNIFIRALLENDISLAKKARDVIANEIKLSEHEGIKYDNSFHLHGPQQQFGNYGLAFISSMSLYSQVFSETSFQFDQDQLNIISNLVNDGFHHILWNGYMDINALGRQLFHKSQPDKGFMVGFASIFLSEADKENSSKYDDLLNDNFGKRNAPTELRGLKHFWNSDLTIQRQPQWMGSLRMSSKRVIGTEAGNDENKKGYHLADGAFYTYINGDEYLNIFPCWDWRKIPGITAYDKTTPLPSLSWDGYRNNSDFVGNVTADNVGFTVMDFDRDGIFARKAWLFTDDYVLCLGAGITSDSMSQVTTSIEQQLQKGDLYQLKNNKWKAVDSGSFSTTKDIRFHCGQKGFIMLNEAKGYARTDVKTGSWNEIMSLYPIEMTETQKVFSLWLSHGEQPKDARYEYLVFPAKSKDYVKQFELSEVNIISNTKTVQAVSIPRLNKIVVVSYIPADIQLPSDIHLKSDSPALFILSNDGQKKQLTISDPTQKLETIEVQINHKNYTIILPAGNKKGTFISIDLD